MSINYDNQIELLELEYQLNGQENALRRVELECLKMKKKIDDYDTTRASLRDEIQITKDKILTLKGGEK